MKNITIYLVAIFMLGIPLNNFGQDINNLFLEGDFNLNVANTKKALNQFDLQLEENSSEAFRYIYNIKSLDKMIRNTVDENVVFDKDKLLNPFTFIYNKSLVRPLYLSIKKENYNNERIVDRPLRLQDYTNEISNFTQNEIQDSLVYEIINTLYEKNVNKAEAMLAELSANQLNSAIVEDIKGIINLKKGNLAISLEHFSRAIKMAPDFSIAFYNRAICHKLMGNFEDAEQDLYQATMINRDVSLYYFSLAQLNKKLGRENKAIEYYKEAKSIDENYEEVLVSYSQLLKGLGEYDKSLSIINNAITSDPSRHEKIFQKANLYFVFGEYDKAIKQYDNYLIKNPADSDAKFNRGLSHILVLNNEKGCLDLQESLIDHDTEIRHNIFESFCERQF